MNEYEIIKKYWFFNPDPTLKNNLIAFGFECGKGWYNLINELCFKIEKLFDEKYPEYKKEFAVTQVKEKFGGLSFYVSYSPEEILDLIDEYEEKSYHICEICGKVGELRDIHKWYVTLCDEHFKERIKK